MTPVLVLATLLVAVPVDPQRLEHALGLERAGDDAAALKELVQLEREQPQWEIARLEAARLRLKGGQELDQAQLDLEVARSIAPENPRGHYLWALLLEERGQRAEAIASLELAVRFREDYDEARLHLAGLYFTSEAWVAAELHYRRLARAHPAEPHARLQLAAALEHQGKIPEAEKELKALFQEKPRAALVGRRLIELYERTGRAAAAAKVRASVEAPERKLRPLKKSSR